MKYIIELEDMPSFAEDGIAYYKCKQAPWWFVGDRLIGKLTSAQDILSEIDKINQKVDEAYQRGLKDGKKAFDLLDAERDSEYQRGLDDAWEAARKIAQQWEEDTDTEHRIVIDDSVSITLNSMTASEAIAKLKAYKEQNTIDEIKVGDVVKPCVNSVKAPFVVTKVSDEHVWGVDADGSWNFWNINDVTKTDKHFNIAQILEEMKG